MRAAQLPTTAIQAVGARGRRELSPSRRPTTREQSLPWAVFSFSARWFRVNHRVLTGGIPAVAVVCSKGANAGSCPRGPRHATVARPVKTPHAAGAAGWPVNGIGPLPTANNTAATKFGALASAGASDRRFPSRTLHPLTSNRHRSPGWPSLFPPRIHPQSSRPPAWVSAPLKSLKKSPACRATGPAATSSSFPQCAAPIKNSVRACVARRYDACASGKPDSGSGGAAVADPSAAPIAVRPKPTQSCRHLLRMLDSNSIFLLPPRTEEEAGGPVLPVPRFLARNRRDPREASHGPVASR